MKSLLVVCCGLAALLVGAFTGSWLAADVPAAPYVDPTAATGAVDALRAELAALTRRLEALEKVVPESPLPERSDAQRPTARPDTGTGERRDAAWYLEQYVLSFADDAQGVEYYRLAVDAHAAELVVPIAALVREGGRQVALRMALVNMLGKRRFAEVAEAVAALLAAVPPPAPDALALRALEALARIGSPGAVPGLEAALPLLGAGAVRERAVALLVELAGDEANAALLRVFLRAPDDGLRRLLVRHLDGSELAAALELLRTAADGDVAVRLEAARKVGEYDEPGFDEFVARWRQIESDAQVLAALGGVGHGGEVPGWSPRQAIGPPDADRTRDDPKAWAPKSPEMGRQWLQLSYATPVRTHGVRIFEVNACGAVAEVLARGPDGAWVVLWRGTADGAGAPLVITFPLTPFPVRTLRLVLDTNRTPGWNEIDAVELLGPGSVQWANRATASSAYGGGGAQASVEAVQFLQGVERQRR